jgi:Ferritin-like domain
MKTFSVVALLAALAAAHPSARKRAGFDDVAILNYALTLEHLEDAFYRQGLANFTHQNFLDAGFLDPFYQDLVEIAKDEATHVQFLTTALQCEQFHFLSSTLHLLTSMQPQVRQLRASAHMPSQLRMSRYVTRSFQANLNSFLQSPSLPCRRSWRASALQHISVLPH